MSQFQVADVGQSVEGVRVQLFDACRQVEKLDVAKAGEGGRIDAHGGVVAEDEQADGGSAGEGQSFNAANLCEYSIEFGKKSLKNSTNYWHNFESRLT